MIFIDFSPLQAVYFALGAAQIGLVLLRIGIFAPDPRSR